MLLTMVTILSNVFVRQFSLQSAVRPKVLVVVHTLLMIILLLEGLNYLSVTQR